MAELLTLFVIGSIIFYPDQKAGQDKVAHKGKEKRNPIIKLGL